MKIVSTEEKFKSPIFTVVEEHAVDPSGFEIKRAIVVHKGSAVVLAVDDANRMLLVRQFRLPARDYLWELPAGRLDEGETPLHAAKRELAEETGYRAANWHQLTSYFASPGFLEERMTIFLATGLTEGRATPMDDEQIDMKWYPAEQIGTMIDSGEIIDGKTIIGYYRWLNNR